MNSTLKTIGIITILLIAIVGGYINIDKYHTKNNLSQSNMNVTKTNANGIKIIAMGDSLTAGYGLPAEDSYPAQLESELRAAGYEVSIINSGVSGETTAGALSRAEFIANQDADIILLGTGGNDALRFLPTRDAKSNMDETIKILKGGASKPTIYLLKMQAPLNAGLAYKKDFDAMYDSLAEENGIKAIPFIVAKIFLDNSYKLDDGIHLNKEGYAKVIDEYIFPAVAKGLAK